MKKLLFSGTQSREVFCLHTHYVRLDTSIWPHEKQNKDMSDDYSIDINKNRLNNSFQCLLVSGMAISLLYD